MSFKHFEVLNDHKLEPRAVVIGGSPLRPVAIESIQDSPTFDKHEALYRNNHYHHNADNANINNQNGFTSSVLLNTYPSIFPMTNQAINASPMYNRHKSSTNSKKENINRENLNNNNHSNTNHTVNNEDNIHSKNTHHNNHVAQERIPSQNDPQSGSKLIEAHSLLLASIIEFPIESQLITVVETPDLFHSIRESILFMVNQGVNPGQLEEMGLAKELIIVSLSGPPHEPISSSRSPPRTPSSNNRDHHPRSQKSVSDNAIPYKSMKNEDVVNNLNSTVESESKSPFSKRPSLSTGKQKTSPKLTSTKIINEPVSDTDMNLKPVSLSKIHLKKSPSTKSSVKLESEDEYSRGRSNSVDFSIATMNSISRPASSICFFPSSSNIDRKRRGSPDRNLKNRRSAKKFFVEPPKSHIYILSDDEEDISSSLQYNNGYVITSNFFSFNSSTGIADKALLQKRLELAEKELEMLKLKKKLAILQKKKERDASTQSLNVFNRKKKNIDDEDHNGSDGNILDLNVVQDEFSLSSASSLNKIIIAANHDTSFLIPDCSTKDLNMSLQSEIKDFQIDNESSTKYIDSSFSSLAMSPAISNTTSRLSSVEHNTEASASTCSSSIFIIPPASSNWQTTNNKNSNHNQVDNQISVVVENNSSTNNVTLDTKIDQDRGNDTNNIAETGLIDLSVPISSTSSFASEVDQEDFVMENTADVVKSHDISKLDKQFEPVSSKTEGADVIHQILSEPNMKPAHDYDQHHVNNLNDADEKDDTVNESSVGRRQELQKQLKVIVEKMKQLSSLIDQTESQLNCYKNEYKELKVVCRGLLDKLTNN